MFGRTKVDPRVCNGKPTIRGIGITVDFVLELLADRCTIGDVLKEHAEFGRKDVPAAIRYGAVLASERKLSVARSYSQTAARFTVKGIEVEAVELSDTVEKRT